ncbi:MAG: extracellular solute-binding protein [Spirochaetaceae bacterium]|nr:extracellular solute-binding protein [Spirochaetaceae bacterium]
MKKFSFIAAGAAALALSAISACSKDEGNALYIYNWTYYLPETIIEKFQDEYKVKVVYDQYASNEEMYAKIQAGGAGYDMVFPTSDFIEMMTKQGMFAPIDHSKLSNTGNIDPRIIEKAKWDPNMEYFVPYYYGAATIAVNTARIPEFDESWKTWKIFERGEYKGKMTMLDDLRMVIGGALMSLGYSTNSTNMEEVYAARDLINSKWKPNIMRFDSEAFGKGYSGEDFWIVHSYFEGIQSEISGNKALAEKTKVFVPREGAPAYLDGMCILKDAKNKELAHIFIDFFLRPAIFAEFADNFNFPPTVNVPARELVKSTPFVSVDEFLDNTSLDYDVGEAIKYYNDSWFETIRIGK